jgi:hypothetical protein
MHCGINNRRNRIEADITVVRVFSGEARWLTGLLIGGSRKAFSGQWLCDSSLRE